MSLVFNKLSRLVIAFLPRSKHLLISWLQSPPAVILEPQGNKVCHCFHCFPIYLPEAYFMLKVALKTLCDNGKMGRRPEQKFLQRQCPGGQEAHGEVLHIIDYCIHTQSFSHSVVSDSATP